MKKIDRIKYELREIKDNIFIEEYGLLECSRETALQLVKDKINIEIEADREDEFLHKLKNLRQ